MYGRPQLAVVKDDVDSSAEPTLVSLESALQNVKALVSREEKLKREVEWKNREIQILKEKLSEKGKECLDLKELISRTREERDGLSTKLKENEVDKEEIFELKRKNCDLECEKLRAQTDVDVFRGRFDELKGRVLKMEKEFLEMKSKLENCDKPVDTEPAKAGKRKGSEAFVKNGLLSDTIANPTGGSSHGKRFENEVVIIDSDDDEVDADDNFQTPKSKRVKAAEHTPPGERSTLNFKGTGKGSAAPPLQDDS